MNLLYRIYFLLPRGFLGYKFDVLMYKTLKLFFDNLYVPYLHFILNFHFNGLNKKDREKKIIVSLTSHPGRINSVWISLATILRQKVKPDKVILWLAKEQFPELKLPKSLIKLKKYGLTIRWCDEDLRSHKKYYYAFKEFQNDIVITVDDDFYYPNNLIKNLFDMYLKNPDNICATRVHKITFSNELINPYNKWILNYLIEDSKDKNLFFTSGSGTLFTPNHFIDEVFNKEIFKKICFFADDVWLNFLSKMSSINIISNNAFNKEMILVKSINDLGLVHYNVHKNGNDIQIKSTINHYKIKFD